MANGQNYQVAFSLNSKLSAGFNKAFSSAMKSVVSLTAGIAGAYAGFRVVGDFLKESEEGAKAQIEAETKLQAVLKNTKGVTDAQVDSIKKYADELEASGVVSGDVALAGTQQLGTYQLQAATLKKLMPSMNDLIVQQKGLNATQGDAVSIGNLVGKVMMGQTGALKKVGISFNAAQEKALKYGNEQEKAAMLCEVLKLNVGGVNAALAKTDQGKIKQFSDVFGSLRDEVGKCVLSIKAKFLGVFATLIPAAVNKFKTSMSWIETNLVPVFKQVVPQAISLMKGKFESIRNTFNNLKSLGTETFEKIKTKIMENQPLLDKLKGIVNDVKEALGNLKTNGQEAFDVMKPTLIWIKDEGLPLVADGIMWVAEKATEMYNTIKKNWGAIEPIILGIAAAIVTYKVGMLIATGVTKAYTAVTKGMAVAQGILNAVMNMSPLGLIAIAIGLVVAAGVYLWKNWDTIKAKALQLWASMQSVFGNIGAWFQEKWNSVLTVTTTIWNNIQNFLSTFPLGQAFLQNINNMVASIKTIFSGITTFISGVFSGNWQKAWEGIQGIFSGIVSGWAAIFKIPINNIIGMINMLIGGLNNIHIEIPDWAPGGLGGKSFGVKIPTIPQFAKGTNSTPRGPFIAGEKGPELISGAPGRRVFTNSQTKDALSKKQPNKVMANAQNNSIAVQKSTPVQIVYKPSVIVKGGGDPQSIAMAIKQALAEEELKLFAKIERFMNGLKKKEKRLDYGRE